jgi:hypothetical protein
MYIYAYRLIKPNQKSNHTKNLIDLEEAIEALLGVCPPRLLDPINHLKEPF